MASISRRMVASVLFVLLLLVATEMGPTRKVAEARHCVSQSHRYRGPCWRKSNCRHVCNTEGFTAGECRFHDAELKCFCKKTC